MKLLPDMIQRWVPGGLLSLGTDGFGRSESREALRRFFEVDAEHICLAAVYRLVQEGKVDASLAAKVIKEFDLDSEKADPLTV